MFAQTQALEKYHTALTGVTAVYSRLYNLISKERDLILSEDVRNLAELILQKEEILGTLDEAKEAAAESLKEYKLILGYGDEQVPLIRLMALMPEDFKYRFERVVAELKNYSAGIRTMSTINKKLVADTMKFINFVIDFMKKSDGEIETYSGRGVLCKKSNERNFLDISL